MNVAHRWLNNYLSLWSVWQILKMHSVLTPVKIKNRTPETRLDPCLIYFSRLEQISVEVTDEHIEAHGLAGGSYNCCTKYSMTLRYDVQKAINCTLRAQTNIDISKIFNVHRKMVTLWIKENELAKMLEEPADNSFIISTLKMSLIAAQIWVNCTLVVWFALKV